MTVVEGTDARLAVTLPHTGEVIDLDALDDLALGKLFSETFDAIGQWRTVQRGVKAEIERRAKERGYDDGVRRVYGKYERRQRVVWEQAKGGDGQ